MAELGDLRVFLTILEHGSVNSAARSLFISASTASRRLAALEREYDVRLFDRADDGLHSTPAAETMAEHARRILLDEQILRANVGGTSRLVHDLRVITTIGLAQHIVAPAARTFAADPADVPVSIATAKSAEIPHALAAGGADVAVCFAVASLQGCRVSHTARTGNVAVMDAHHPLAGRQRVTIADLLEFPVAILSPGNSARSVLERAFARRGRMFRPAFECDCPTATSEFLRGGECIGMLAEILVGASPGPGLVAVPVADEAAPDREVLVLTPSGRGLHMAAQRFVDAAVKELGG